MYAYKEAKQREYLSQVEACYDALHPAQEKGTEAFSWRSDLANPFMNVIMHLIAKDVEKKVDALLTQFPPQLPLSFWVHHLNRAPDLVKVLEAKGFQLAGKCPLMTWDVRAIELPAKKVERVTNFETFCDISAHSFHFDDALKREFGKFMQRISSENYLVYLAGQAVGVGSLCVHQKVGLVFNVGTLPEHQKKGCASALMQFLMRRAKELGLEHLLLISSPAAEKMYNQLGFEKKLDIEIYAR